MTGHLVRRIRDEQALDAEYDREAAVEMKERSAYRGDSFDAFCRRQRARLSSRLERAVTRVRQHSDTTEIFESRK